MHRTNPDLTRQDDVFFRPGVGTLADRATVQRPISNQGDTRGRARSPESRIVKTAAPG